MCNNGIFDLDISDEEAEKFLEVTKICMKQSYLRFIGKIFRQTSGLSMGNSVSPLLTNLFMSELEIKASKSEWFPRVWYRYVDDVFAIIKKGTGEKTKENLNNLSPSIKFTHEREDDGKLPFSDLVIMNVNGNIFFLIFSENHSTFLVTSQPTQTNRAITN
jgi:hypothetical protein